MSEVIVDETRAAQLDLLARAKFAQSGEEIWETRHEVEAMLGSPESEEMQTLRAASKLEDMASLGMIEVG